MLLGHPWIHDIHVVPSMYHQCVKFPHNGAKIVIPGDNIVFINTLTATKKFIPHNNSSHNPNTSLVSAKQKLKMMSLGMGEYTLDSIATMHVSPRSYGKPSEKMKSSASTMTLFGNFVQASVPLEAEKEEQAIREWIYREEEDTMTDVTPISPDRYGKGYTFLQQMGYHGQGPLNNNGHALAEPLSHNNDQHFIDTTGLGYGVDDAPPEDTPMLCDSDADMDE